MIITSADGISYREQGERNRREPDGAVGKGERSPSLFLLQLGLTAVLVAGGLSCFYPMPLCIDIYLISIQTFFFLWVLRGILSGGAGWHPGWAPLAAAWLEAAFCAPAP